MLSLTQESLCLEAAEFSRLVSQMANTELYGVTDGKAVGTFLEHLNILHTIFVEASKTADFQMTRGIINILNNEGNKDDLIAFMLDRNLPVDEIEANNLADEILNTPPSQGFLTISNALQWRLQYSRVIECAGNEEGIIAIY